MPRTTLPVTVRPPPRAAMIVSVIVVVVATLLAGLVFLVVPRAAPSCAPTVPAPVAQSPIRHVFFLIKENHAFENYFGDLSGAAGYPPNGSFPVAFGSNATVSPFPLGADSTPDLPHDRASELVDEDGGRNDLFVAEAAADGYSSPKDAVGYYTTTQLPDYYAYAHYYAMDDMFFSGVLGPTLPNRLFDLGLTGTNWTSDFPPPASAVTGPTFPGQLAAAGVPWDYFYTGSDFGLPPMFVPQIAGDGCLFSHLRPIGNLQGALAGPDPPAFAYIDPENDPLYSEHPPSNVTLGEEWTAAVINEIFESPIGNTSAIFLFYDEAGGFWDPVVPPSQLPHGDGFRVPLLVLSPWTGAGEISHQAIDPANLIRWVENNWGLSPLNARIGNASAPTGFFNFSLPARAPLILPTPVSVAQPTPPARPPAAASEPRLEGRPSPDPLLSAAPQITVWRPRSLSRDVMLRIARSSAPRSRSDRGVKTPPTSSWRAPRIPMSILHPRIYGNVLSCAPEGGEGAERPTPNYRAGSSTPPQNCRRCSRHRPFSSPSSPALCAQVRTSSHAQRRARDWLRLLSRSNPPPLRVGRGSTPRRRPRPWRRERATATTPTPVSGIYR